MNTGRNEGPAAHPARGRDPYDHLEPDLIALHAMPWEHPDRARLRAHVIDRCLPLADHLAARYRGRGQSFDDLQQVARVGLVLAVDRYDPARGDSFLAFAIPTVTGELRRYFRDYGWTVRVPRRLQDLQQKITTATPRLAQQLRRTPTREDLAVDLEITADDVDQAALGAYCYRTESLEAFATDDEGVGPLPVGGTLAVDEDGYQLLEDALAVAPHLETLSADDRHVLILRFYARLSQQQIGEMLGMSQVKVSRILARILGELRDNALAEVGAAEDAP
ncbi:SigB/SigF/SigG family RNA polymerase sigma factor [Nocardia sp. BMG111209]|uniref:SigB/SigF/SigG family RNA polymerase sigma factor n=1 Tax=Nocardia sp. BMG111209 TaxID=1160137 RepID=UPI00036DDE95|nr:SigB/SigF/SigG family RNA polymerase sigma factor [Nocardia sp. BMG111209]